MLLLLTPDEESQIVQDYLSQHPIETEIDLLQAITGISITDWHLYGLKAEVVAKVAQL